MGMLIQGVSEKSLRIIKRLEEEMKRMEASNEDAGSKNNPLNREDSEKRIG